MKKIFITFLFGQLLIFSFLFNKSIYSVYGLTHIGDTTLDTYKVEQMSADGMGALYDSLTEEKVKIQVIKMPISEHDISVINYDIYHSHIEEISKFISVSGSEYHYYALNRDEFIDSTGVFYTDMNKEKLEEIATSLGLSITPYENESYLSFKTILIANALDFIILLIITVGVIFVYGISKNKSNAVKVLLGYSSKDIMLSSMKEMIVIQLISIGMIVSCNSLYYYIKGKCSLFYVCFLFGFLILLATINLILLCFTSRKIKKIPIVESMKNKRFSKGLDYAIQVLKIVLILLITIAISQCMEIYHQQKQVEEKINSYQELNSLYTSYGYNSDEYDKISNNTKLYQEMENQVKAMYQKYSEDAYIMIDNVLNPSEYTVRASMGETETDIYGMTKEELFNSYVHNSIICNKNYVRDYIPLQIISGKIDSDKPTLIVPKRYQKEEKKVREQYKYSFGNETTKPSDLNIVYVEDDYTVKLLSDLQYEGEMDITIKSPIIIIDNGNFSSGHYFNILSQCELVFSLENRTEFQKILTEFGLEKLYFPYTMLAPFMIEISNYQFMIEQTSIFIALFVITLFFTIYISNYIHMHVSSKRYGTKYELGYSTISILFYDMITSIFLLIVAIGLALLGVDIKCYILFVALDFILLFYFYYKIIVKDLYKILNGGC